MSDRRPIEYLRASGTTHSCGGCGEGGEYLTHWHHDSAGRKVRYHRGGCCPDPYCWAQDAPRKA